MIKNVLIYGGGMMGKGIAFVMAGNPELSVTVYDVREMDIAQGITESCGLVAERGLISRQEFDERLSRIGFVSEFGCGAMREADLVIECVFEDMALKQQVFNDLEAVCRPDTVFCTNTSVMSPTEISQRLIHKERFVGTHFWNPAHLIALVEVVKAQETSEDAAQAVMELLASVGKRPVLCKKDVPGFIANRMQHALWREAIHIVESGIADAATVDEAVKHSFGLRLPQLGPLENADMVGLDLTWNIHDYILPHLCDSHEPSPLLTQLKEKGELGFKSGRGFQAWDERAVAQSKNELNEYLIHMQRDKLK